MLFKYHKGHSIQPLRKDDSDSDGIADDSERVLKESTGRLSLLPELAFLDTADLKKSVKRDKKAFSHLLGLPVQSRLDRELLLGILDSDAKQ